MTNYNIRFNQEKNVIHIGGVLNSENIIPFDNEIMPLVAAIDQSLLLILDIKNLEYSTSSGLRTFLKIAKQHKNLKIVNANQIVYSTLEMTGFTTVMNIVPQLREVSVAGLTLLGEGFVGSVYKLDNDKIIKVYKHISSVEDIFRERDLAKKVFILGVPTALSYEVVKIKEGGFGSVFELVNSQCLNKIVANDLEHADKYLDEYSKLIKQIITTPVLTGDLPDKNKDLVSAVKLIEENNVLDEKHLAKLKAIIESMPEAKTLIHGDCHFKNIMVQNGEFMLIDMDTVGVGSPYFEFAGLHQAYICYPEITPGDLMRFMGLPDEIGVKAYELTFKCVYGDLPLDKQEEIRNKILLVSYIFLLKRTLLFQRDEPKKMDYCLTHLSKQIEVVNDLD